jgi:hypothetical protein
MQESNSPYILPHCEEVQVRPDDCIKCQGLPSLWEPIYASIREGPGMAHWDSYWR